MHLIWCISYLMTHIKNMDPNEKIRENLKNIYTKIKKRKENWKRKKKESRD